MVGDCMSKWKRGSLPPHTRLTESHILLVMVSKWERGEKAPSGASLKLLTLVKNKGLECIA